MDPEVSVGVYTDIGVSLSARFPGLLSRGHILLAAGCPREHLKILRSPKASGSRLLRRPHGSDVGSVANAPRYMYTHGSACVAVGAAVSLFAVTSAIGTTRRTRTEDQTNLTPVGVSINTLL